MTFEELRKKIRQYGDERQAEAEAGVRGSTRYCHRHAMEGARLLMEIENALYELLPDPVADPLLKSTEKDS